MPENISAGVITQSRGAHLREYFQSLADSAEAASVAVADDSGECFALAGEVLGGKLAGQFRDAARMLAEAKPRLALVSMEPLEAPGVIDLALEAGCHVLAEKPACVQPEAFVPLVRKAQGKHLEIMLALANRVHGPAAEARRLVREGLLGRLYGLSMHLIADQARLTQESYRASWRCSKDRAGGGHLVWLGIHWLDLATYITGLEVERVAAFVNNVGGQPIDVEDSAAVCLQYGEGVAGTLLSAFYLDEKFKANLARYQSNLHLWGEHGWLRLATFEDEPLQWYSSLAAGEPRIRIYDFPKGRRSYEPFVRACVRFAAGLEESPPITSEESLRVLQTVYACYRAAETGKTQEVG